MLGAVWSAGSATRRSGHRRKQLQSPAAARATATASKLDVLRLRADFPALQQQVRPGVPLVYFDNAATSQKPTPVLSELSRFYSTDNSNVHRGMHTLSIRSTEAFEGARSKVASFINANDSIEVIFTRNATEAINLVARSWGRANVGPGDEIVLSVMEHHSNLVPWQQLAEEVGAKLRFVPITKEGVLDREAFEKVLSPRTKLVSMCHVSNVLGCVNPVEWVAEKAHAVGARFLIDACQSTPHMPIDVQKLGADWLVASSHKMCGPTGIGFLWGKAEVLRAAPPFLGGGEMIDEVQLERSTYTDIPHKLEAGTPAFAEAVGLGAACDYLSDLGMEAVAEQEHKLTAYLWQKLSELPGVTLYGPSPALCPNRAALVCFNVDGCHPMDLSTLVDQERGVAMRAGHHCCQPLHRELGVQASARLSAYFYNTEEEIDVAVNALRKAIKLLRADASELDLMSQPSPVRWGVDVGPQTVLQVLQERGLIDQNASCPALSDPSQRGISVGAAFSAVGPIDVSNLAFLRWCQLYGHATHAVILHTGTSSSSTSAATMEGQAQLLRASLQLGMGASVEDAGLAPLVVVDEREWLLKKSAMDLLRDAREAAPNISLTDFAGSWSLAQFRVLCGVHIQAGPAHHLSVIKGGAKLARQHGADAGDAGALPLEPLRLDFHEDLAASPYALYKTLLGTKDEDLHSLLRQLTGLPLADVDEIGKSPGPAARERLAEEATRFLYGEAGLDIARRCKGGLGAHEELTAILRASAC